MAQHDTAVIEAFLLDRTRVTGDARDRVVSAALSQAFVEWARERDDPPVPQRVFEQRLAAMAAAGWRCPNTGKRFSRIKRSSFYYAGLVLVAGV
jgi:hypothetical protein